MAYPYMITCLQCRTLTPLHSIDPIESPGEPWVRLRMGCGHAPSLPERHRDAIERLAGGDDGAYVLYDPDHHPTYLYRSEQPYTGPI